MLTPSLLDHPQSAAANETTPLHVPVVARNGKVITMDDDEVHTIEKGGGRTASSADKAIQVRREWVVNLRCI
jgi:hypothetical protein